jgi:hypothetical protein
MPQFLIGKVHFLVIRLRDKYAVFFKCFIRWKRVFVFSVFSHFSQLPSYLSHFVISPYSIFQLRSPIYQKIPTFIPTKKEPHGIQSKYKRVG